MTRIIAGAAGGRRIATPPGDATRPTTDRVREALFSSLESQLGGWEGVRFLDVFAGSGAIGLESLSRGAAHATFIESDRRTSELIRRNVGVVGVPEANVIAAPAVRALETMSGALSAAFDAVFLDPPYDYGDDDLAGVLELLGQRDLLAADAVVVVERAKRSTEPAWPGGVEGVRAKRYGATTLWYGRRHRAT